MATIPKIVYNFNENSTSTIRDYSENGNDGIGTGITLANSTRVGKDAVFTDSTNNINLGNITYLNGVTDFSLLLAIKVGANAVTRKILTKSGVIDIEINGFTSVLTITIDDSVGGTTVLTDSYTANFIDYHLVCSSNDVTLYADGVSVDTGVIDTSVATNTNDMIIGYDGSVNSAVFNLNELKIFDDAITTDNIAAFIAEQNGIYSLSAGNTNFNVGDVIGTDLLEGTTKYGIVSYIGTANDFRFLPLSDNIASGKNFRRVGHLWDTDRQWALIINDTPEICFYDGMSKSSEVFATSKKLYCLNKEGIIKNSTTKTANYTVTSSDQRIYVDSSGGTFTITLEASPTTNREIEIIDSVGSCGSNNVTISGNGNNINGSANDTMSSNYDFFILVFNGSTWNRK